MNMQQVPTFSTPRREQHSIALLPERWLLLARGAWITLAVFTVVIFFTSIPPYLAQLQTLCTQAACQYQQLTPEQAEVLKGMGLDLAAYAAFIIALLLISVVMCLGVSALIIWRRPNDRMAFIVALMLITLGPLILAVNVQPAPSFFWISNACLSMLAQDLLWLVFFLFPSGQFVPGWTRFPLVVFLLGQIPFTFLPLAPLLPQNPSSQLNWLVAVVEMAFAALVQCYRYWWISTPRERQQTKWVVFGFVVLVAITPFVTVQSLFFPEFAARSVPYLLAFNAFGPLLTMFIALSFGFAMLYSRLWDIDTLINRALVYGLLTVLLAGIYAGLVVGLQVLLRAVISQDNGIALVGSTLAIAALFQPLRQRIQVLIDRRFYRRRYDAEKTLQAFSASLRDEVDVNQLSEQLIAVVSEAMQPVSISLWLTSRRGLQGATGAGVQDW
ncbi:MAG: hypothetical protein J2P37_19840 [Ktedonobacteraceae bacterium]|nr:hypothetical protein [Ktedonobacteraceae bacterium]